MDVVQRIRADLTSESVCKGLFDGGVRHWIDMEEIRGTGTHKEHHAEELSLSCYLQFKNF